MFLLYFPRPDFQTHIFILSLFSLLHVSDTCLFFQRQPPSGRPDERAAYGDDRTESESYPSLVPEQAVQGKPENINSPLTEYSENLIKVL